MKLVHFNQSAHTNKSSLKKQGGRHAVGQAGKKLVTSALSPSKTNTNRRRDTHQQLSTPTQTAGKARHLTTWGAVRLSKDVVNEERSHLGLERHAGRASQCLKRGVPMDSLHAEHYQQVAKPQEGLEQKACVPVG